MSVEGYQNQLDISRNDIPLNQQQNQVFNFNRETSELLQPATKMLKYCVGILALGTVSVFYLAFYNIRSSYFLADSVMLIILGLGILIASYNIVRLFSNGDIPPSKKKCQIVYLTFLSLSIAAASASYLINAKIIEWCGMTIISNSSFIYFLINLDYVVTFNGPLSEQQINIRLEQIGVCKGQGYDQIRDQAKSVVNEKCGSSQSCKKSQLFITNFKIVQGTTFVNVFLYLILQILLSVYIFHKIAQAQTQAIAKQSVYFSNHRPQIAAYAQSNLPNRNHQNQNNPPQIYQAQLAPAFFTDQNSNQNVVIGQPIHEDNLYNNPNIHTIPQLYQTNDLQNSNL